MQARWLLAVLLATMLLAPALCTAQPTDVEYFGEEADPVEADEYFGDDMEMAGEPVKSTHEEGIDYLAHGLSAEEPSDDETDTPAQVTNRPQVWEC